MVVGVERVQDWGREENNIVGKGEEMSGSQGRCAKTLTNKSDSRRGGKES